MHDILNLSFLKTVIEGQSDRPCCNGFGDREVAPLFQYCPPLLLNLYLNKTSLQILPLDSPAQGLVEPFPRPDHNDQDDPILRIDFIDNPVLASMVADMIGPKTAKFMRERISLVRICLNVGIVLFQNLFLYSLI